MPKFRQPAKLETLATKQSAVWLCNVGANMIELIKDMTDAKKASIDSDKVVEIAHDLFERFVPYYLYKPLSIEVIKGITNLVAKCKETMDFRTDMAKFLGRIQIAIHLAEALISTKLRVLDFEETPKMIRTIFYTNLKNMNGLEYLNLGSLSAGWETMKMEYLILDGLQGMNNLQHLSLNYDCTDKILMTLAEHCPKLVSLDITNSKNIENKSIDILVDLKHLKVLQLYRTSVTMEGYINILLHLPELLDVGRYDQLGRCLEFIDDYHPTYKNFKLANFASNFATTKQIQILCECCPNIRAISLFHNILLLDLMTLIGLNNLCRLKLLSCDFFADQIKTVLEVKGCNITHLDLEHVDEIDMNALIYISQFCPDLKSLTMCNCNLIDSTSISCQRLQVPPFMNLEHLTLIGDCSIKHIEFILCNAFRIKFIHFGTQVPTNDGLFEKIFLRNELLFLEELRILHSDFVTIKTAYDLVDNCVNLQKLYELDCWLGIIPGDLDKLKRYIKEKNYDVDLTSFRNFVTS